MVSFSLYRLPGEGAVDLAINLCGLADAFADQRHEGRGVGLRKCDGCRPSPRMTTLVVCAQGRFLVFSNRSEADREGKQNIEMAYSHRATERVCTVRFTGQTTGVSDGRRARLQRSPREGPESCRRPSLRCGREIGFAAQIRSGPAPQEHARTIGVGLCKPRLRLHLISTSRRIRSL